MNLKAVVYTSVVMFIGCKEKQTQQPDKLPGQEIVVRKIPADIDDHFDRFIEYFSKDSFFQVSRIAFPLNVQETDWQKDYELSGKRIKASDYRMRVFSQGRNRSFDDYTQKIIVNKDKATIEIRGVENGLSIEYFFEKRKGKWMLITWIDNST